MEYAELIKMTQSFDPTQRSAAEAKLQEAKDANPGAFMLIAAKEFFNSSQVLLVRITSAALIKRTIIHIPVI